MMTKYAVCIAVMAAAPGLAQALGTAPEAASVPLEAPPQPSAAFSTGPAPYQWTPSAAAAPASAAPPQCLAIPRYPFLPTGFTFPALMPDAVFSYNMLAPVIAITEDDIRFNGLKVIPKGSKIIGVANTVHSLDRINITWNQAVFPDGREYSFGGMAFSWDDGSSGIKGKLEKHSDQVAAGIALQSALGALNTAAMVAAPGVEAAIAQGFSQEAQQQLRTETQKVKSLESVYVKERTPIKVFVSHRFIVDDNCGPR